MLSPHQTNNIYKDLADNSAFWNGQNVISFFLDNAS